MFVAHLCSSIGESLMPFCQSIYLVITIDTFYWLLLSKSSLSQSEVLLDKSRSALLVCAIHVFNTVSLCHPFFAVGRGHSERDPDFLKKFQVLNGSVAC